MAVSQPLRSHKGAGVHEAIEAAGAALLYLPPYSPDFAERTVDALCDSTGALLIQFAPNECCRNFFHAAGCEPG